MKEFNIINATYKYNGKEYDYSIYTNVDEVKKQAFVNTVVKMIVTDEGYQMFLREKIFYFQLISVFTDIFTNSQLEIRERGFILQEVFDFIDNTSVIKTILDNLDTNVFDELIEAVNISIEYKTGIHRNPITEGLGHLIETVEKKFEKIDVDSLIGFANAVKDIPDELTAKKIIEAYASVNSFKTLVSETSEEKIKNGVIES